MRTGALEIEWERVQRVLRATAHGLYWNKYRRQLPTEFVVWVWRGPWGETTLNGIVEAQRPQELHELDRELDRRGAPIEGAHEDIFWFQCLEDPPLVLMTFYSEIQFFAVTL